MKALIFLSFFLTLCFGGSVQSNAQNSQTARVQINSQKRLSKSRLTISFVELVEDSRCPTDTNCIWAGNAKIKIRLTKSGKPAKTVELNTNPGNTAVFGGYKFQLKALTPQPATNIRINRNGYVATISVSRA